VPERLLRLLAGLKWRLAADGPAQEEEEGAGGEDVEAGRVRPGFAEKESDVGRRWFGPIDLRVAELSATVPPLRGQRSRGERGKKLAAPVGMTPEIHRSQRARDDGAAVTRMWFGPVDRKYV